MQGTLSKDMLNKKSEDQDLVKDLDSGDSGGKFYSLSDHSNSSENESLGEDWADDKSVSSNNLPEEEEASLDAPSEEGTMRKMNKASKEAARKMDSLAWDYSFSPQLDKNNDHGNFSGETICAGGSVEGEITLSTLYQTIMAHREETKVEGLRTQGAVRRLQNSVRRVAKTCMEISTRIGEAEARISTIEDDMVQRKQR